MYNDVEKTSTNIGNAFINSYFQRSLWDLFQPSRLDNLQTLAIVNLALLKKNTVDPDVVYCPKIGADETKPRLKELRF